MNILKNQTDCCGCRACEFVCSKKAVAMTENTEGFFYPTVNNDLCIDCGLCVKRCPVETAANSHCEKDYPEFMAARAVDEDIVFSSSSGGLFSVLANHILDLGGAVVGAGFDDDFRVVHQIIESKDDLHKLQGSKYVQSDLSDCYVKTEALLKSGKIVLFSGTSCQIEGFKNYLNRQYENLYLVDIICHGVPTPKLWEKYIEYQEGRYRSKIVSAEFRNKDTGWLTFSMKLRFDNQRQYRKKTAEEPYMRLFLNNCFLRESCYSCKFKTLDKPSDFTLSDFWKIKYAIPELDDDKGTSLVFVNTAKGKKLLDSISSKIIAFEVSEDQALFRNPAVLHSSHRPPNRDEVISHLEDSDIKQLVKISCVPLWRDKFRRMKNHIFKKYG